LIDLGAGIAVVNVGNAAPRVVEAVQQQVAAFTHTCFEATMLPRLQALQARTPAIGDVRGRGAMIAVELVRPGTTEPDAEPDRAPSPAPATPRASSSSRPAPTATCCASCRR
jgi:4-aminobutyrate aminotransferase-like enzyme